MILMTKSADNLICKGWIIDFAIQEKIHVKKDNVEEEIDWKRSAPRPGAGAKTEL